MTDSGEYLWVDSSDLAIELPAVLKAVEQDHRRVRILRNGKAVVELVPIADRLQPSKDPDLKVTFSAEYDPAEGLAEEQWLKA